LSERNLTGNHFVIDSASPDAGRKVCLALLDVLSSMRPRMPLLVVCVGTDRSTGDSLGPLVGSMLLWNGFPGQVLGTLDNPVHAANLHEVLADLENQGARVLGVDACLGTKEEVGSIIIRPGSLKPGLGVKKKLPPVGDLHIAGVVNIGGFMEYMVLQNTRLSLVMKMARTIALGISAADRYLRDTLPGPFREGSILVAPRTAEPHPLLLRVFDPLR